MKRRTSRQCSDTPWEDLREWFQGVPGRLLLEQEQVCREELVADLFGYYLLQIGFTGELPQVVHGTRIRNRILMDDQGRGGAQGWTIQGQASRLPLAADSIDVVILQHTLDFASDPTQVLREAERVLIPEGRVLVFGFNPWSLWGLWRMLRVNGTRVPWCGWFLGPRRVLDWLSLLGFDLEASRNLMFRPPLSSQQLMHRVGFMESLGSRWWPVLSGVYVLQAVKRVSTLTPIKPRWAARSRVVGAGAIEPTA